MALSPFFDHLSEVFGKTPRAGVCHIGAHKGQEVKIYKEAGFNKIILVEPSPRLAYGLLKLYIKDPMVRVVPVAISSKPEIRKFFWTKWDQHRSLLQPTDGTSRFIYVPCLPLSMVPEIEDCNLLVMDIQGGELDALKGAALTGAAGRHFQIVVCEIRADSRYQDCPTEDDIVAFMAQKKFSMHGKWQGAHNDGVFDAAFKRK